MMSKSNLASYGLVFITAVIASTLFLMLDIQDAKLLTLYLLLLGGFSGIIVLTRYQLDRPLLLFALGFSLILNPNKFFGPLDLEHFGGVHGFFISLTDLVLFCLIFQKAFGWNRTSVLSSTLSKRPFLLAIGLYLLFAFLSTLNAKNLVLSFAQIFFDVKCFALFFFLAFFLPQDKDQQRDSFILMLCGVTLGVLIEMGLVVAEYKTLLPRDFSVLGIEIGGYVETLGKYQALRVGGTYRHPNYLAIPMAMLLPILGSAYLGIKGKARFLLAVGVFAALITLVLTLSRTGYIAGLFGLLFFLGLSVLRSKRHVRLLDNLPGILVGAMVLVLVVLLFSGPIITKFVHSDVMNIRSRIELNEMALEMILTYPFLGVGINNHSRAGHAFESYDIYREAFGLPPVVHNIYLLIASEIGVIGLLAFLWFFLQISRQGWQFLQRREDATRESMAIGLMAGLGCYLISDLAGFALRKIEIAYLIWWCAGMLVFLSRPLTGKPWNT